MWQVLSLQFLWPGTRFPPRLRIVSAYFYPSSDVYHHFHLFLQSSVCEKIMELLGQNEIDHHQRQVVILSQDSFYKVLTPEQKAKVSKGQYNFDHPGMHMLCGWWHSSFTFWRTALYLACSKHVHVRSTIHFSLQIHFETRYLISKCSWTCNNVRWFCATDLR